MTAASPSRGQEIRLVATCLFAIVGAVFLLLLQVSREAAAGYNVQHLQRAKADLEQRTYLIEAEMASLQSLDRIEKEARTRLKMQPTGRYVFVTVDVPSQEGTTSAITARPWWGSVLAALGMWR